MENRAGMSWEALDALICEGDPIYARDRVWEMLAPLSDLVRDDLPPLEQSARRVRNFLEHAPGVLDVLMTVPDSRLPGRFFSLLRSDVESLCSRSPRRAFFVFDSDAEVRSELNEIREYVELPEDASAADVAAHARALIVGCEERSV